MAWTSFLPASKDQILESGRQGILRREREFETEIDKIDDIEEVGPK